ncbi:MAG: type II toxin-antitoxin system prevent-host-death family antitoxin [Candidatus Eisenbacteria bacterium]|nr:type II toxin-antitoxin system prevent-host-death family antitoxin [Candidatus Eisenbacteria bacterium]
MPTVINAKTLRNELAKIVRRVRKGDRFTVLYRSRPAFQIVPIDSSDLQLGELKDDPIYESGAVGRSKDGKTAAEHDETLYGTPRR